MTDPTEVTSRKPEAGRQKCRLLIVALVAVAMFTCAKKMLPPSPDRFPPHLQEVETRTRSQVALVFDEDIDGAGLAPDSFSLNGPAGETLALRGASLGRNDNEVQLWTPTQELKLYEVRGTVRDRAGNPTRFRARFRGSSRRDTIAPRVVRVDPAPGSARKKRGVSIRVTFSEAIDTSGAVEYIFMPAEYDTQFKRSWTSDWQTLSFVRLESISSAAIVYFLVQPRATDLEGNRVEGPAFTYFGSDTIFDAVPVRGRVSWPGGALGTGTVLFQASETVRLQMVAAESLPLVTVSVLPSGLAPVLTDGSFATKLRKGEYEVVAVADTNADGLVELASPVLKFSTDAESLSLTLEPESLPEPVDAYRR